MENYYHYTSHISIFIISNMEYTIILKKEHFIILDYLKFDIFLLLVFTSILLYFIHTICSSNKCIFEYVQGMFKMFFDKYSYFLKIDLKCYRKFHCRDNGIFKYFRILYPRYCYFNKNLNFS